MINVFLYCSYSGSAVGYQQSVVDESRKIVRKPQKGEIPKMVSQIWTHGGANAAAGCVNGTAYFLVKRMIYQNADKQTDERGQKTYMNCAFTGSDTVELQRFADGFTVCYQAVLQKLGGLLVVDDTEVGYTICDLDGLHELESACIETGKRIQRSRVGVLDRPISFIALEGDWNYFAGQNNIPLFPRPKHMMEAKTYQRMITESRNEFPFLPVRADVRPPEQSEVPPTAQTGEHPVEMRLSATEVDTVSAEEAPPAEKSHKRIVPPPDHAKELEKMEKRVTDMFRKELEQEKDRTKTFQQKIEEENARIEREVQRQSLWIRAALVAVLILLVLILFSWGR